LSTGLADYDELQEGLAVFAEYGVGGLSASRMRVLAARVLAAHSMEHGAEFIETFRLLTTEHGFARGTAFDITERVHQCGGFNRDMIYLRGLLRLVEHLRAGGALEPLYVGKVAAKHIEIIDELLSRGVLVPPPLLPRWLDLPGAADRIDAVRNGLPLTEMIGHTP
ncbi:MAG TPA: tyrosine/phenylalanine carboxypeptidase domain-containing protein, partial [Longimicrobiales bacterium]|nr:tyrosine/phenylalanine carboxypeptidase domain-containing protein [Longimicrobiales bacterium]